VLCPVRESMGQGGVVALGIAKGFEGRHLDSVEDLRVIGTIAAIPEGGVYVGKETLGPTIPPQTVQYILTLDVSVVTMSACRK
jgi:hypothetical protein